MAICSQRKPRSFRCSAQPAGSRGVRRINVWAVSCSGFRPLTMAVVMSPAPDFTAETTEGTIHFYDWIGDGWVVLLLHPKDFTPVCTTELGYMAKIKPEFDKRGVKIISLSVAPLDRHSGWANDIKETQGFAPNYPMIADIDYNRAPPQDRSSCVDVAGA